MSTFTSHPLIARTAVAATLAALLAGVSACGTEHGTPSATDGPRAGGAGTAADPFATSRANQAEYLRLLLLMKAQAERAERADALRWAQGHRA